MDQQECLDFEVQIGEGHGRSYPVTVIRSPAGEPTATMRFPFSQPELEIRRKDIEIALLNSDVIRGAQRRIPSTNEQPVKQFGQSLFRALFTDEVRSCYQLSLAVAQKQGKGLRVKLRIGAPELAELPWEFLFDDDRQNEYLGLCRSTPLVRYLEVPRPIQPLTVVPPLRILGLVASPDDLDRLDVGREQQRVDGAVADLRARGLVDVTWMPVPTFRELQREMRSSPWHVFHFTGHGGFNQQAEEGYIALADETGKSHLLSATQLSRLLSDQPNLRLVVLNACEGARGDKNDLFSSTAALLVRRGIPAVVAMQYPISDSAAIEFAHTFYEVTAEGLPVDRAVSEARIAISVAAANTVEWGTPVLVMHSPDGVLFDLPAKGPEDPSSGLYTQALSYFDAQKWREAAEQFQKIVDRQADYRDVAQKLHEAQRHTLVMNAPPSSTPAEPTTQAVVTDYRKPEVRPGESFRPRSRRSLLLGAGIAVTLGAISVIGRMWLSGSGQSVEATPPAPTTVAASVPTILPSSTQPVATSPSRLSPATPRLPTLTTAPPTRTNLDISKEIIFVRRDASDNPTGQAWILDQTGSRSSKPQLFGTQLISNFGSWSVPREEILYDLQRSDTDRQIFRMGKDGRNSTPVSPQGWYAWNGVWAPNGKFAAFAAHPKDSPSAQIYVIEVENAANIQQVTNNSKYNQHPSWSADGQFLAFESDQSGSWNIWVVPVNDEVVGTVGAALQLTFGTDKQLYQRPFWSSDMSSITLTSLASDANQEGKRIGSIWRLPVVSHAETAAPAIKGGKLEQLTQGDDEEGMISPDGVRLIFTRWNASHNKRQLFAQNPSDKNTAKPLTDANYDCSTFIYVP